MTLYRGVAAARQVETTETSSTSGQQPVSFGSVVSKVTAPKTEEEVEVGTRGGPSAHVPTAHTSSTHVNHGCHLCGQPEGGSCCSTCHKIACSQHIRVKIDQKAQKALP
eukprot:6489124-Amphidinium_carterae.1